MNNQTERLEWLDFMKGVAIFLVVLGHVFIMDFNKRPLIAEYIYSFHMPFFFLLTGILSYKSIHKPLWNVIKRKAYTLLMPFVTVGLFYSVLYDDLHRFLFDEYHAGYWFMLSIFLTWLFFIISVKIASLIKNNLILDLAFLSIPYVLLKFLCTHVPASICNGLSLQLTMLNYRFFIIGFILGVLIFCTVYNEKESMFRKLLEIKIPVAHKQLASDADMNKNSSVYLCFRGLLIILYMSITISYLRDMNWVRTLPEIVLQTLICISLLVTLKMFVQSSNKCTRIIAYVGKNSLTIYLFHYFLVRLFAIELNGMSDTYMLLFAIVLSSIIIALTLLFTIPIRRNLFLNRIFLSK